MKNKVLVLSVFLAFAVSSAISANESPHTDITNTERKMAESITAEQLKDYLYFLASDAMGGRDTPSNGLDITAQFLALNLKRWGFKPAGDNGTFFQEMTVRTDSMDPENTKLSIGSRELTIGKDFSRIFAGSNEAEGALVFCKTGWMVKSKNIKGCDQIDVRNKIVVLYTNKMPNLTRITNPPEGVTSSDLPRAGTGSDWADPLMFAGASGAKGIILVASPELQKNWAGIRPSVTRLEKLFEYKENSLPVLVVSQEIGEMMFAGESGDQNSDRAFEMKKTAKMLSGNTIKRQTINNVVAIWEGSDPKLKAEMVSIGAHYDAQGIRDENEAPAFITLTGTQTEIKILFPGGKTPGGDNISNGADDNASGTVAVLGIAEALAKAKKRPKRSVLFVWNSGEEKGLWGSKYYNKYPTVDLKNVVSHFNLDMVGRSRMPDDTNENNKNLTGPDEVYVMGSEMMSSVLGSITKETNNSYLKLKYNYKYDDPKDPNRYLFRSDHISFARSGIPFVNWFSGSHQDYHSPGDSADKIDYQKLENITRTVFLTLWKLSELRDRPMIDKELPPELKN
ncbi:MAG: M28 family peptidase [Pyrinomonadaceae bacterium]